MTGANSKGPSSSSSYRKPSSSHGKSRWESPKNHSSDLKPTTTDSKPTKPSKPSSKPKQSPASLPGPSKPHSDAVAVPGSLPAHGPGLSFHPNDPAGPPPFPDFGPPPQPAYGFHMLDRRTIVLADGSVRSYFAVPPDYQDFPPPPLGPFDPAERFLPQFGGPPEHGGGGMGLGFDKGFPGGGRFSPEGFRRDHRERDFWNSVPPVGEGSQQKRKYGGDGGGGDERDERDEFARQRQQLLHYGNPSSNPNNGDYLAGRGGVDDFRASKHMRGGGDYDVYSSRGMVGGDASLKNYHHDVLDPQAMKKSFLHYVKLLNENPAQKRNYLEDGKQLPLQCLTCGRASREFPDMHGLIMHTYNSLDLRVDHLGLHKALCVLMGWNHAKVPDNSRAYQLLSADEAEANKEDIILWPPMVIIHNTSTGRGKDGRMEGMGNKLMDNKLKDLGISGGKSKSLYGKEGHLGITLVKFAGDQSGLKEAMRLSDFFEKENHGRKGWARAQSSLSGRDEENNANLVKVDEKTGEKKRIFYGYLGTASDLEKLDVETRKKAGIESLREFNR